MKVLTTMLFAAAVVVAGGCKKKEDNGAAGAPTAPAKTGTAPSADQPTAAAGKGGSAACTLLTGEKLSELTGVKFGDAQPAAVQGETSACYWTTTEGSGSLSITYYRGNTGKEAWKNMAVTGGDPVAGVGDEAFAEPKISSIRVRKGDNVASLSWRHEVTPEQQNAVASEVASHM